MEIDQIEGQEKDQTHEVQKRVSHGFVGGHRQYGAEGRNESDPFQQTDLRKDHRQAEKQRAEDEERARREAEEAERLENERRAAQSANPEWWDNGSGDKK